MVRAYKDAGAAVVMHHCDGNVLPLLDMWIDAGKDPERDGDAGHQAAGTGVLDYAHYLRCLERIGFEGTVALHRLSEEQVPAAIAHLRDRWPG